MSSIACVGFGCLVLYGIGGISPGDELWEVDGVPDPLIWMWHRTEPMLENPHYVPIGTSD